MLMVCLLAATPRAPGTRTGDLSCPALCVLKATMAEEPARSKLTRRLTATEQEGGSSVIAQWRHHQLRDTSTERCLD